MGLHDAASNTELWCALEMYVSISELNGPAICPSSDVSFGDGTSLA